MKRYAAPGAFLLAVTAAVLAVHYGIQGRSHTPPAPVTRIATTARKHAKHPAGTKRYAVVQSGDSFSTIAARTHTSVAELERLNPDVSPTALRVGQKIRVH